MMSEFDKLKDDYAYQLQKNDDMNNNVSVCMGQKRRTEDELNRLMKDFDDFKA